MLSMFRESELLAYICSIFTSFSLNQKILRKKKIIIIFIKIEFLFSNKKCK
jgi:hypothetical protein